MKRYFELTAGHLCLDFANTLDDRPTAHPTDRLRNYSALLAFGRETGVLSVSEVRRLKRWEPSHGRKVSQSFQRAIALRESIFRIFSAAANKSAFPIRDVWVLNTDLRTLNARAAALPKGRQFDWLWRGDRNTIDHLLWAIIRSAIDVLTSNSIKLLRQCAAEDCDWLFMDNSRSHNRRWCEMKTCGNRHKAREYYRRKAESRTPPAEALY